MEWINRKRESKNKGRGEIIIGLMKHRALGIEAEMGW